MSASNNARIGDLIELFSNKNTQNLNYPFYGINKDKMFMPTVANTEGLDATKYTVIKKGMFVFSGMQTGRDVCIRIGLYENDSPVLVSPAYTTFIIKDENIILPEYLFLFFNRFEMDRYGWFLSDSSIRSNLDWDRFCDIKIPLPSIEVQRELVSVYTGLKSLAEENEALLQPLSDACQAFIVDCKNKYPLKRIDSMITPIKEKNSDLEITLEQGINIDKEFITPQRSNSDLSSRIKVRQGQFAYCTQLNNENTAIAYRKGPDCVVSPVYAVFEITRKDILLPEYLFLWLRRKEFGRYVYWGSIGSAYEFFQYESLASYEIPVPPLSVQQKVVDLFNCYAEAKSIAEQAREQLKTICPALVQKAAHTVA